MPTMPTRLLVRQEWGEKSNEANSKSMVCTHVFAGGGIAGHQLLA
jgi:hypothetical protein